MPAPAWWLQEDPSEQLPNGAHPLTSRQVCSRAQMPYRAYWANKIAV
jgi:hypothetical protein